MNWIVENEKETTTCTLDKSLVLEKLKDIMEKKSYDGDQEESEEYSYSGQSGDSYDDRSENDEDYYDSEEESEEYSDDLEISEDEKEEDNSNRKDLLPSPMNISITTSTSTSATSTPEINLSSPLKVSTSSNEDCNGNNNNSDKREMFDNLKPNVNFTEPAYLEYEWVFYYDDSTLKGQSCDDYQSFIKNLGSFNTIQGFWGYWNNIINSSMFPDGANLRLFKKGIAPMWEDPNNENGGKWTLSCHREHSHSLALVTILALIGEQLDYSEDICGFVLSVRSNRHVISIWNKSGEDKEIHDRICEQLKESVYGRVFKYFPHKQLEKSNGSVPPSPISTPSNSSYNLRLSSSSNHLSTPPPNMKRENSSPMISSTSKLPNSQSFNNDLYKSSESINNSSCNNSNNLMSSFENVKNNSNQNSNNRKDSFKHKKSQSTSSINYHKSPSSSSNGSNNNSNVNTPLKNSRELLNDSNSNSTPKLNKSTSIEVSSLSSKFDQENNNNNKENNNMIANNIMVQIEEQTPPHTSQNLLKSNSRDDLKSSNGYYNKKYQFNSSNNNTPQKRFNKNEPTSSKPPLAPVHNSNNNLNISVSNINSNNDNSNNSLSNQILNNITLVNSSPNIKEKDQIEEIIIAAASASGLIVVEPSTPSSEISTTPPSPLSVSKPSQVEDSLINQDQINSSTEVEDVSLDEVDHSSDLQTDVSNNVKSKKPKKSKKSKSNNNHHNQQHNSKLKSNTVSRKKNNQHSNNDKLLNDLVQDRNSNKSIINFIKDHKVVFIMLFSILLITVMLQRK